MTKLACEDDCFPNARAIGELFQWIDVILTKGHVLKRVYKAEPEFEFEGQTISNKRGNLWILEFEP